MQANLAMFIILSLKKRCEVSNSKFTQQVKSNHKMIVIGKCGSKDPKILWVATIFNSSV
jgi:hypothetical protein